MDSPAISTEGLSKRYGARTVLQPLTLTVPAGRLFGLLGPNGAGKTTTIRILLGLLRASAGRAAVFGRDVWRAGPAVRAEIGYLPGDVRFYDPLSGAATLAFLNRAHGGRCGAEIARLADRFELPLGPRVRTYSRGMKQKLGLIAACMHRPRLLILDEPTTALDPLVRQTLFAELRAIAAEGRTVLFSSHTLSEVEELCDEVAILREGRLVEHDRIERLRARAVRHVEVVFADAKPPEAPPNELHVLSRVGGRLRATWIGPVAPLLAWLGRGAVQDVTIGPPDLEDLFMAYYAEPGRESAA